MRVVESWVDFLSGFPWVTLVAGSLGLFLLVASAWALRRRRRQGSLKGARVGVMLVALVVGFFLTAVAALIIARWPPGFRQLFLEIAVGDEQNPSIVESLQAETFENATEALAGDWPQWRGPRRDGVSKETGLRLDWQNQPPKVLWRQPHGSGYSSLAVAGERLYTMDKAGQNERVLCLAADTGTLLWAYSYAADYREFRSHQTGPRATPTVHDGRVYTVGATGKFLCLEANPATGQAQLLWQHDLIQEFAADLPPWGVACSPLIEGDNVIVQTGGTKGSVVAFKRVTGETAWTALTDPSGYSSPVVATVAGIRQVIAFTGGGLAGLRPSDGKQLWYYAWQTPFEANVATPIVTDNCVFISSDYNTGCALLKLSRAADDRLKPETVYLKRNKLMRNHQSTCILDKGFLYGFDTRDSVARHVRLRCFELRTGEEKWAADDLGKGVPILAEGYLIALMEDGELLLAEATPDAFREKGRFRVFTNADEVWALPALANGRLYLRSHKEIVCVDVRK